jgi:hypothetical protein
VSICNSVLRSISFYFLMCLRLINYRVENKRGLD